MPFHRLSQLIYSALYHVKGVEPPAPEKLVAVFDEWIKSNRPIPKGWDWEKRGLCRPLDFLIAHFDPLFIPLMVVLVKRGEKYSPDNVLNYIFLSRLSEKNITEKDQKVLWDLFNFKSYIKHPEFLSKLIEHRFEDKLPLLLENIPLNKRNSRGETPLHTALREGNYVVANGFVALHASLNVSDEKGVTPRRIIDEELCPKLALLNSLESRQEEKEIKTVTEEEFQRSVQQFLEKHQTDLPTIFSPEDSRYPLLRDLFLVHPIIYIFLSRSDFTMGENNTPAYTAIEKEVLMAMDQGPTEGIHRIPYRTENENGNTKPSYQRFYFQGTSEVVTHTRIRDLNKTLLNSDDPIYCLTGRDMFSVISFVDRMSKDASLRCNEKGFAFVIAATPESGHIAALLSVIHVREKRVLFQVLLNSLRSVSNFNNLSNGIDQKNRFNNFYDDILLPPLLDASFDLQTENEDSNCGLYTLALCEALFLSLRKNKALQDLLSDIPLKVSDKKVSTLSMIPHTYTYFSADPHTWQKVVDALHLAIKSNAPLLFERDSKGEYKPRPYEQRKQDFFKIRWQVGRAVYIQNAEETRLKLLKTKAQIETLTHVKTVAKDLSLEGNKSTFFQGSERKTLNSSNPKTTHTPCGGCTIL